MGSATEVAADDTRQLLRWLSAIDRPRRAIVTCADAVLPPIPADAVGVRLAGCVLGLRVGFPAQLLAWGVGEVRVSSCPADARATEDLVESWGAILDGVAIAPPAPEAVRRRRSGPILDLGRPVLPRRLAFGLPGRTELPFDLDLDEAGRALAALRILQGQGRARLSSTTDPGAGAGTTDIVALGLSASGCTACGVCVRACPTGALELVSAGGVTVLQHTADRCRAHRSCVDLCPQRALTAEAELTTLDVVSRGTVEVARVETSICRRCGAVHPALEGPLCPACAFRASSAFGSRLPPGYTSR